VFADCLKLNLLSLNIKISKFILIDRTNRPSKIGSIQITAVNKALDQDLSFLYLGIVIKSHFTWEDHVEHIRRKVNKENGSP